MSALSVPAHDLALPPRPTLWRRLFHIVSGSSIPLAGIFVPKELMVGLLAALSGLAIALEMGRFAFPDFNRVLLKRLSPLLKQSEGRSVTGATYVALSALFAFLLFDKAVAVTALLFLSLGDPIAALVGSRVGGPRPFGKSPLGTLAFFIIAMSAAAVLMAAWEVEHHWAIAAGAAIAALVELTPLHLDDNLTIPLISGGAMTIMLG